MLIKSILENLPLTPGPGPSGKLQYSAGAAIHQAGRCGEVLSVDVYDLKGLLYRFFSDGKNYITQVVRPFRDFSVEWTERNPVSGYFYDNDYPCMAATQESIDAVEKKLGSTGFWRDDIHKVGEAISRFVSDTKREQRDLAWHNKMELQKRHFAMFPAYPADLAKFCENKVFQESVMYISKLEKGKRRATCRHCGKSFRVGREIKPGGKGVCPKCGLPVIYRAEWVKKSEITHKAKICIACKVDGQLLLRYTDVVRTIEPGRKKPSYRFSDYFKTLFLVNNGKATEYAYAWTVGPYYGYDWRRQRNGTENYGDSYVYTENLREVFGDKYYNVDLQTSLSGIRRPICFRRLLDNLKNIPQTEYLVKSGLFVLASDFLPKKDARNMSELLGIGRSWLPVLRETQADFYEIKVIVEATGAVRPEDFKDLCALRLDRYDLQYVRDIMRFNTLGHTLRYVQAQRSLASIKLRHNKLSYFITLYRDYLNMADTLQSDMSKRAILEPRDLKERHDLLVARINEQKDELENQRFKRAIDDGLYWWAHEYANKDYCVVYPQKRSDLTTEGQCLNHCVGMKMYYENHIAGRSMIFFIRSYEKPDKPFFTAEIDVETGRIQQLHGFGNCSAPKEVRSFTEGFAKSCVRWRTNKSALGVSA